MAAPMQAEAARGATDFWRWVTEVVAAMPIERALFLIAGLDSSCG